PTADALRGESGRALLANDLLQCYLANMLGLLVQVPRFTAEASARPVASPLARLQARQPSAGKFVTTLFHQRAELSDLDLAILPHLDGSRDRAALLDVLLAAVAEGALKLHKNGQSLPPETIPEILKKYLHRSLQRLARCRL